MKANEAISAIMESQNVTRARMASILESTRGTVGNQLNGRNEMSLSKVMDYLEKLNYEVAFVPVNGRLPKGSYVIDRWSKEE